MSLVSSSSSEASEALNKRSESLSKRLQLLERLGKTSGLWGRCKQINPSKILDFSICSQCYAANVMNGSLSGFSSSSNGKELHYVVLLMLSSTEAHDRVVFCQMYTHHHVGHCQNRNQFWIRLVPSISAAKHTLFALINSIEFSVNRGFILCRLGQSLAIWSGDSHLKHLHSLRNLFKQSRSVFEPGSSVWQFIRSFLLPLLGWQYFDPESEGFGTLLVFEEPGVLKEFPGPALSFL